MLKHHSTFYRFTTKCLLLSCLLLSSTACRPVNRLEKLADQLIDQVIHPSSKSDKSAPKHQTESKKELPFFAYDYKVEKVFDINGQLPDSAKGKILGKSFPLSQAFTKAVEDGLVDKKTGQAIVKEEVKPSDNPSLLIKGYEAFKGAAVDALSYSEEDINQHIQNEAADKSDEEKATLRQAYKDERQSILRYVEENYLSQEAIINRLHDASIKVDSLNDAYFSMNSPFLPDSFWLPIHKGKRLVVGSYSKGEGRPDAGLILVLKRQ